MRLTKKDITYITSGANVIQIPDIVEGHKYVGQAIIKLGQLEDIEDELGIDLIVYLHMTWGCVVYKKDQDGIWEQPSLKYEFNTKDKVFMFYQSGIRCWSPLYKCEDYGKTWALTKEELL